MALTMPICYHAGMNSIPSEEITRLRTALEEERAKLEEELNGRGRVVGENGDWQGTSGDIETPAIDPNEVADQIEELANNTSVVEELESRHKDVVRALEKMEEGTYGVCEGNGETISLERLNANPAARTCVEHAS